MMTRHGFAAWLLALSALLAGCPESVHPVSDPAAAVHDSALFGTWHGTFEGDEIFLHVGPAENGLTRTVLVEHSEKGGTIKFEEYVVFPTRLKKLKLLNVRPADDPKRGYTICRYKLKDDDELTLWMTSYEAVSEDIKAGKLKGIAAAGQFGETRITASSAELVTYLQSVDRKRLFDKPMEFERFEP